MRTTHAARIGADLIHDIRDLPYTYKGEVATISGVKGDFCPACAESILDATESDRVMREIRAFSKQVNASIVDPGFIVSVRKKLVLDQREAAEIFGGGEDGDIAHLISARKAKNHECEAWRSRFKKR